MNTKKAGVLLILLLLTFSLACTTNKPISFRFVFMTDIHIQPEQGAPEGFKAAIKAVNSLNPKPDFVITGGDLIMDALEVGYEQADSLYDLYLETAKLFDMPVYNTIGNHEIFGLYTESNVDPSHAEYGKAMFANRIGNGKTYRSFDYQSWHFVLLDAIAMTPERRYIGQVDSTQLEWLKQDLAQVGIERSVCLVSHIPFYTIFNQYRQNPTAPNSPGTVITNANEITRLSKEFNVKLVLQGHLHTVEAIDYYGVKYIIGGAVSGAWWNGARDGFPEGFVVVDVQGDKFDWRYETYGWDAKLYN